MIEIIIITALLGLAIIYSVYFIFTVGRQRERDIAIVSRHLGDFNVSDWWNNFMEPGNVLRDTERKRLKAPHNLQQQKVASKEDLPVDFTDWDINICYRNRKDPFPYKHYFLKLVNDGEIRVNIVDTMGSCDTFLENKEAAVILLRDILSEHSKIDKVVFVTYGDISLAHQEAIIQIMDSFQYPRQCITTHSSFDEKKDNFVFLYNKTEKMTEEQKLTKLKDMGKKLGADIGHEIPVMMLVQGMEEKGVKQRVFVDSALATGVNCDGEFDAATKKTYEELKAALLPHTRKVLKSPKRLNIAQMQCPIQ